MDNTSLVITDEELMAATGEDRQQGGSSIIKYVTLVQKIQNSASERYSSRIATEKDPVEKKRLQTEMLAEMEKEVPLGGFSTKDGKDEFGLDIIKNLGNPFIGQILKTRYSWATKFQVTPAMRTSEADTQGGMVTVFNDNNEKIDQLPGTMLKLKYPTLKMQNPLYVFEETSGTLYKITVKGDTFGNWFAYQNSFPRGISKSSFETIFGSEKTKREDPKTGAVNEYYVMTFKRGSAIENKQKTMKMLRELNDILGTTHVGTVVEDQMTPQEAVAVLNAPTPAPDPILEDFKPSITASTPAPTVIQPTMGLKARGASIAAASAKIKAKHDEKPEQEPPGFLKPEEADPLK